MTKEEILNLKPVQTKFLVGQTINLPGALDFDNNLIDIKVKTAVDCYNRAFIIINGLYVAQYNEVSKYMGN